jgi:putative oxidoreductase
MLQSTPSLVFPALGTVYATLAPLAEALLRVVVGVALVMHGLRMTFGFFPDTGIPLRNVRMLAAQLDRDGYRPGKLWAPVLSITQLVGGPLLTVGLFTRLAAVPIVVFLAMATYDRWRTSGYFWNRQGFEYTLLWGVAALYFLVHGGGTCSLDHLLGWEF